MIRKIEKDGDLKIEEEYGDLKIARHSEKIRSFLEEGVTAPIYVRVKPTNRCNHHCFYCAYDPQVKCVLSQGFRKGDMIPKEKMEEILSDFRDIGVKAVTFSGGGEPLTYPYIANAFEKTLQYGIDLSIITNGQELKGRKADLLTEAMWVRISLDAADPKTFSRIRRVPEKFFIELVRNIGDFARKKDSDCEFGINFVVHKENSDQIYKATKLFMELGVDHVKFTPVWVEENFFGYHAPIKQKAVEQIERARQDFSDHSFKVHDTYKNDFSMTGVRGRNYPRCYIMQIVPVIGADSAVYFCHDKTYTENGCLGSIRDRSFRNLWFSKEAAEKFRNFDPREECKQHCTYDKRNRVTDAILRQAYGRHANFI